MIIDVEIETFLMFEILMFQILILVSAANNLNSESAKLKILAADTKIKILNIKTSNVRNSTTSTSIIMFDFRAIFKIFEVISSA